jgi:hypothetical protein
MNRLPPSTRMQSDRFARDRCNFGISLPSNVGLFYRCRITPRRLQAGRGSKPLQHKKIQHPEQMLEL